MCDPLSFGLSLGAVAATSVYQTSQARKSAKDALATQREAQGDPEAERAKAEAEAAQRANAQLADTNRRRREQNSLMSKGAPVAPQFSMGDSTTDPGANTLSTTGATTRSTTARKASLMSKGAAPIVMGGGYGGGGSGGGNRVTQMSAL